MERRVVLRNPTTFDKCFKDRYGRTTLYQRPNIPQAAWVVLTLGSIFTSGSLSDVLWYLALLALAIWSLLEVFRGVNYFRRVLGIIVIVVILLMLLKVGY